MHSNELVDLLADRFGYESLLHIGCEAGSDAPAGAGRAGFRADRLTYDPASADGNLPAFLEMVRSDRRFDVVSVDAHPDHAARDLLFGLNLLTPRGTMVVLLRDDLIDAYVDFTVARKAMSHVTVDATPRFGLIARNYRFNTFYAGPARPHAEIDWYLHRQVQGHALTDGDRAAMLRMIPVDRFTALMDDFEVFSS